MADTIRLELDARAFIRSLRLTEQQVQAALAKAVTRTAFEVRDAEAAEVGRVFEFAGSGTRQFLAGRGAFRITGAKPERLEATVFPAPKTGAILAPHQRGATITGGERGRLTIAGQLATPIAPGAERGPSPGALTRTGRGRIRRRGRRGSSFIRGHAVLEQVGTGARRRLRVLFALTKSAKLEPRFDFYRVARDVARRTFALKARQEFGKIRVRG